MKFNCGRSHSGKKQWHKWYAWHPVTVGEQDCRWLEPVERRLCVFDDLYMSCYSYYEYRPLEECNNISKL